MSVTNQTNKTHGTGNGSKQDYDFDFKIFDATEIYVYLIAANGTVTGPLSLNTDYTVSINDSTEGGTVTFTTAPTAAQTWFIKRVVPFTQTAVIPSEGTLPGKQIENQLDLMMMALIQVNETVGRGITIPPTFLGSNPTLPLPVTGYLLGWDSLGNIINYAMPTGGGGGGGGSDFNPPIADSQIQTITTAGKVLGAALNTLSGIPAGAGVIPVANIPTLADSKLSQITTASKVSGAALTALASIPGGAGVIPLANIPSGTTANKIVALDASAKLPAIDGSQLTNLPSLVRSQIFTVSGSWLAPAAVHTVFISAVGGGGGGDNAAWGAGSGAFIIRAAVKVTPGNTYTVTVGTGGATEHATGGTTSFAGDDTTVTCLGGSSTVASGPGGAASGAYNANAGTPGSPASTAGGNGSSGGAGGGNPFGTGGSTGLPGTSGIGYGSGGGKAAFGANGMVLLEW
jgi:hypothetical protein